MAAKHKFEVNPHLRKTLSNTWKGKKNPKSSKTKKEMYARGELVPWDKGKKRPEITGENHPNWKGGFDHNYGEGWKYAKEKARKRDEGICYMCSANEGDYPKKFHIHHIVPYRISQDNSLENLITLCGKCHPRIENITDGTREPS